MSNHTPFYEKFVKQPAKPRTTERANSQSRKEKTPQQTASAAVPSPVRHTGKRNGAYRFGTPVFSPLTAEAKNILDHFPDILAQVLPLDSQKKQQLPQHIQTLFHELTDERSSRKTHYLNNPVKLSAYTHYYVWWNLVRLVKLLNNIELPLKNGDYAADFGSGPLTFICALWIAKPELRTKELTWYCVDISHKALSFGEELFLALCAYTGKTGKRTGTAETPWRIKKVCGAFGTPLNEKLALVTEANMFNEVFWNSPLSLDEQADKTRELLMRYLQPQGAVLLIEPGIPLAGEFLSLVRAELLQEGFTAVQPCPHGQLCCFPNRDTRERAAGVPIAVHKWCHFTFETDDSPQNLLKLSEAAHLGKARASLSFIFCSADKDAGRNPAPTALAGSEDTQPASHAQYPLRASGAAERRTVQQQSTQQQSGIPVRIWSDIIMPAPQTLGRYACSEKGFLLLTTPAHKDSVLNTAVSGTLLMVPEAAIQISRRDKKTHAVLVPLE